MAEQEHFPLEKILNVSAEVYQNSRTGKDLGHYKFVGVHSDKQSIEDFAVNVPKDAEVVVNYEYQSFGHTYPSNWNFKHTGTALIPIL